MSNVSRFVVLVALCAVAGCSLIKGNGRTASQIAPLIFLSVGHVVPGGPAAGSFQSALGGWNYVFDNHDPMNPHYVCQHNDMEMLTKAAENNVPVMETCQTPTSPLAMDPTAPPPPTPDPPTPDPFPPTYTGRPGGNPVPPEEPTWMGATHGGCGTWSVAMCNRRLGITAPTQQVSQGEWDDLSESIMLNPTDGTSTAPNRAAYYRSYGYCVIDKRFDGTTTDYEEVRDNLDTCDVKVSMWRRTAHGQAYGHIETVLSASDKNIVTNSWGDLGAVEGGTAGGFGHWVNGMRWMADDGDPTYPPDSTDVMVTFVCPCNHPMMERLGPQVLGGPAH